MFVPTKLEPSSKTPLRTLTASLSRLSKTLKAFLSAILSWASLPAEQQPPLAFEHESISPLSFGISNSTKGLEKSKEQNDEQAWRIIKFDIF